MWKDRQIIFLMISVEHINEQE